MPVIWRVRETTNPNKPTLIDHPIFRNSRAAMAWLDALVEPPDVITQEVKPRVDSPKSESPIGEPETAEQAAERERQRNAKLKQQQQFKLSKYYRDDEEEWMG